MKTKSYKDLIVWQKAVALVEAIYELTEAFPKSEMYGLASQMQRAAISIPSNIAEGYRRGHKKEYIQFLSISFGSGAELETQLEICKRLNKLQNLDYAKVENLLEEVMKMLNTMLSTIRYTLHATNGFTLIELMVALSLFAIVLGISSSIFIRALRSQRVITNLIAVNDNSALVIEQMAREIRVGSGFSVNAPINDQLDFTNAFGLAVAYRLNTANKTIERKEGVGAFVPLTGANVKIEKLNFLLSGGGAGDGSQTRVTIVLRVGSALPQLQGFYTDIQTTLSPRVLDS